MGLGRPQAFGALGPLGLLLSWWYGTIAAQISELAYRRTAQGPGSYIGPMKLVGRTAQGLWTWEGPWSLGLGSASGSAGSSLVFPSATCTQLFNFEGTNCNDDLAI